MFFMCLSCSKHNQKQQETHVLESHFEEERDVVFELLDSMSLSELIPKNEIVDSLIDITMGMIHRHEIHEDLQDFDSFEVIILSREGFQDTLCWVAPQMMRNIFFHDHPQVGYKGYLYLKNYPIFVCGDDVSCLFKLGNTTRVFYSGSPAFDGVYEYLRFRITGDTFCLLDSIYP